MNHTDIIWHLTFLNIVRSNTYETHTFINEVRLTNFYSAFDFTSIVAMTTAMLLLKSSTFKFIMVTMNITQ